MNTNLQTQLRTIKRRWWFLGITAGLFWTLIATVLFLLLGGWLDLLWELPPYGRVACLVAAGLLAMTVFVAAIVRVGQRGKIPALARRVDQSMGFGGAVLTGCELEQASAKFSNRSSSALAHIAVEHAAKLLTTAIPAELHKKAVPAEPVKRSAKFLAALTGLVVVLAVMMPDMMRTQWNRFIHPYNDIPQFSNTTIEIENPEKSVVYGDPLDIRAAVLGDPVDSATLVLEGANGNVETLPMFPEQDSFWRASLAKVTENATYHVRAYRARSTKHNIDVITVPRIEEVRFHVNPPAYTHQPAYEGPLLREGLSGLPGTKVEIHAKSNRPLSRGEMIVSMRSNHNETTNVPLLPSTAEEAEVFGGFEITGNGKFELRLFDVSEQESRDSFAGGITLLRDERPTIRITQPSARSLATSSVVLPVSMFAEDDYGIAKVQLFRSLNDSRFLPVDVLVNTEQAAAGQSHFNGQVELPLPLYGLNPGDTIKLFARVEDNEPAQPDGFGPKGAESSVVYVEIISQEQFEQLARAQNGMELMRARYQEALRRLEAANEELKELKEKLKQTDPSGPASQETRQELKKLAERMRKETDAIRKLAEHPLPYELDKQLTGELDKAANLTQETAEELEKMLDGDAPPSNEKIQEKLDELGEKLSSGKKSFDESTMPPLEILAAVLPLKRDENRFVMLVKQQKDLVERLDSLKQLDITNDPGIKARMRELEDEQRQIHADLDTLLKDIEEHANALSEREELENLREEALKFAEAVRAGGAEPAMSEAQAALAEYSGSRGHAKAKEAAEILEQFLSQCCNGMGQCASNALGFRPSLGDCMGSTLEQLMRDMNFNLGSFGMGGMGGAGDGFGAQRGGPNVGVYGMLPGQAAFADSQGGGQGGASMYGTDGSGPGAEFDPGEGYEITAEGTVSGTGEGTVPLRYRQAVGRYLQRILEN